MFWRQDRQMWAEHWRPSSAGRNRAQGQLRPPSSGQPSDSRPHPLTAEHSNAVAAAWKLRWAELGVDDAEAPDAPGPTPPGHCFQEDFPGAPAHLTRSHLLQGGLSSTQGKSPRTHFPVPASLLPRAESIRGGRPCLGGCDEKPHCTYSPWFFLPDYSRGQNVLHIHSGYVPLPWGWPDIRPGPMAV